MENVYSKSEEKGNDQRFCEDVLASVLRIMFEDLSDKFEKAGDDTTRTCRVVSLARGKADPTTNPVARASLKVAWHHQIIPRIRTERN